MAKINIVVPPLHAIKFSGGIICILNYATGLMAKGHAVKVIPMLPSPYPRWFPSPLNIVTELPSSPQKALFRELLTLGKSGFQYLFNREEKAALKKRLQHVCDRTISMLPNACYSDELFRAMSFQYTQDHLDSDADVTLATSYETAFLVYYFGKGRKFYFAQHYEVYFKSEKPNPEVAEKEADLSYQLGLSLIANSSWLKDLLTEKTGSSNIGLCCNAIDHQMFRSHPKHYRDDNEIVIISYGGREAVWKGFDEMARAVKIARDRFPDKKLRWQVYGDALLPSNNNIAPYEHLGFLNQPSLVEAYNKADILLSASWYESFPLFPIEAMACGLPVITTALGTEDYAIHGVTAEVVQARNPESIAQGIINLIDHDDYRNKIAACGHDKSKEFTWERSVSTMEQLLLES